MKKKDLPTKIAVFPLSNAIFFPKTILPLNIFEKKYVQMVDDCMKENKLLGMVQPKIKKGSNMSVYSVGCLGKIINFNEVSDNMFLISLSGIIRFKIKEELKTEKLYRKFKVDYADFFDDLEQKKEEQADTKKNLIKKIKVFLKNKNYEIQFDKLEKLHFEQLLSTICMLGPFSEAEKQKLMETIKIKDKIKVLEELISFNSINVSKTNYSIN